jgi:hypothetical protein
LGLDDQEANSSSKLYKVLYCLQIIQSLIFEYKQKNKGEVTLYVENIEDGVAGAGNSAAAGGAVPEPE